MEPVSDDLRALLQDTPGLRVLRGLEQLDMNLAVVDDISSYLSGGSVLRQNYADEHLAADLRMNLSLPWETTRLRPYVTLTDGSRNKADGVRCDLGIVMPKRPKDTLGLTPQGFDVSCVDYLARLRREIEATYVKAAGTNVLTEVKAILTGQGMLPALFDGDAQAKTLAYEFKAEVNETDPIPTYLTLVNRLLAAIGYRGLWLDGQGRPRSSPYLSPASRAPEWVFDAQADNRITGTRLEREVEAVDTPNVWIFIQRGNPGPTEGAGKYTVPNQSDGPTSIDVVGRNASTRFLDAADQASLVAQGTRAVESDRRRSTVLRLQTSPFPVAGHFDLFTYADTRLGLNAKVLARSWRVDLGMGNTEHTWEVVT